VVWLKFVLCLAIILFAGIKLARYGDAIAEKTGLGRIWIGLVLLAAITTMPELVTSTSAVALVRPPSPDLALGTLFGSCLFNLSILALLDILRRSTPVLTEASPRHTASAGWGILLIAIAAGGILAGARFSGLALGWVGVPSIIILVVYLVGMRQMFLSERGHQSSTAKGDSLQYREIPARVAYLRFALAAAIVIAAGIWLSFIGDEIAETTGWGASFIGSLFLAITTSAPELVVATTALRIGAIDMAVADVLGANMLDVTVVLPVDLFYTKGSVLSSVLGSHLITAAVVVVMNLLVIAAIKLRQRRKTFIVISWYAVALIGLYIFGAYALFISSTGLR
jgi:cation:H+ antiporter